jgi:hypothetical protein
MSITDLTVLANWVSLLRFDFECIFLLCNCISSITGHTEQKISLEVKSQRDYIGLWNSKLELKKLINEMLLSSINILSEHNLNKCIYTSIIVNVNMNLYIEGEKVLNSVKKRRSAVKTLVYSSQYEVIIPLFIIVLKKWESQKFRFRKSNCYKHFTSWSASCICKSYL